MINTLVWFISDPIIGVNRCKGIYLGPEQAQFSSGISNDNMYSTYVPEVKPIVSIVVICDFEWQPGGVAGLWGSGNDCKCDFKHD